MEINNEQAFKLEEKRTEFERPNNNSTNQTTTNIDKRIIDINNKVDAILLELKKLTSPGKDVEKAYFKNKDLTYFLDKTTFEIQRDYNEFKNVLNPIEEDITLKQLNRKIKRLYPDLEIYRTTKNNQQIFVYRRKDED